MDEMAEAFGGGACRIWKTVGPDGLPAEIMKIDHHVFVQCLHSILVPTFG